MMIDSKRAGHATSMTIIIVILLVVFVFASAIVYSVLLKAYAAGILHYILGGIGTIVVIWLINYFVVLHQPNRHQDDEDV